MSLKSSFNAMRLGGALDKPGLEGETYLTRAVKMRQYDAVQEFIGIGANPDAENAKGETPLYVALELKDRMAIKILLENNANIFLEKNGMTFREHAEKAGMKDVAEAAAAIERERMAYAMSLGMHGFM